MDKSDELLERCFHCVEYPDDCGIYFMMALWQKKCHFFKNRIGMKKTYDEFIKSLSIINEDDFLELMAILPDIDIDFNNIDWTNSFYYIDDFNNINSLAEVIINEILNQWDYVYCDTVDVETKTFNLEDCSSLDDLNEITKVFSNWTINNLSEIIVELTKENEEKEKYDKHTRYDKLFDKLTLDEINEILNKYDNKR